MKPRRKENTELQQQQQQQLNTHQQYSMNNKTLSDLKGTQIDGHLKVMIITTTGFTLASAFQDLPRLSLMMMMIVSFGRLRSSFNVVTHQQGMK